MIARSQSHPYALATTPSSCILVIASLRDETPSLRYTDTAYDFTVWREMYRRSPISRKVRCVDR